MMDFGKGPVLKDASPWLRNDADRIERVLTVTETDSVIEGLPPFQEETRERIRQHLTTLAARHPCCHAEPPSSSEFLHQTDDRPL